MIWRVSLDRTTREGAIVEVEADDEREAKDLAVDMAKKHDVIWSADVTSIEVLGCEVKRGS